VLQGADEVRDFAVMPAFFAYRCRSTEGNSGRPLRSTPVTRRSQRGLRRPPRCRHPSRPPRGRVKNCIAVVERIIDRLIEQADFVGHDDPCRAVSAAAGIASRSHRLAIEGASAANEKLTYQDRGTDTVSKYCVARRHTLGQFSGWIPATGNSGRARTASTASCATATADLAPTRAADLRRPSTAL